MAVIWKGEDLSPPRPGRFVVKGRDAARRQVWKSFDTKAEAVAFRAELDKGAGRKIESRVGRNCTFGEFIPIFLEDHKAFVKRHSIDQYTYVLSHYCKDLHGAKLRDITSHTVTRFLALLIQRELSLGTVRIAYSAIRLLFRIAIRAGACTSNPTSGQGNLLKQLNLVLDKAASQEAVKVKAMNPEEFVKFREQVRATASVHAPLLEFLAGTGCRRAEALALQVENVNLDKKQARIENTLYEGERTAPKTASGARTVDLTDELCAVLRKHLAARKLAAQAGSPLTGFLFVNKEGGPLCAKYLYDLFKKTCADAGLPEHYSPHSLRHTYATLSLIGGEAPQYVQQQLGHASIQITLDTYGSWIKQAPKGVMNELSNRKVI